MQGLSESWIRTWYEVVSQDWNTYEEWEEKYGPEADKDAYVKMLFVVNRFNNIGLLSRENAIDADLLYNIYLPSSIMRTWKRVEPLVLERRKHVNDPDMFGAFEYL